MIGLPCIVGLWKSHTTYSSLYLINKTKRWHFMQWFYVYLTGALSPNQTLCRLIEAQSWHAWFLKGLDFRLTFSKIETSFLQKSREGRLELLYSNLLHSTWGNWIALNNVFINAFQRRMDWSTKVKLGLLSTLLQSYNQVTGPPSLISKS